MTITVLDNTFSPSAFSCKDCVHAAEGSQPPPPKYLCNSQAWVFAVIS